MKKTKKELKAKIKEHKQTIKTYVDAAAKGNARQRIEINRLDKEKQELVVRLQSSQEANSNLKKWNDSKDKRIEELELALDALGYTPDNLPMDKAVDLGVKMLTKKLGGNTPYIGQMPDELNMGVDGQLREGENTVKLVGKVEDVGFESEEWAKRNGHHHPNGRPDKDRSTGVVVTTPEEISAENREKHHQQLINETNEAILRDMEENPQDYPM